MIRRILSWNVLHLVGNRNAKGIKISKQIKIYKELSKSQWNSLEVNEKIQKELLYKMIIFAITNVPYYRALGYGVEEFKIETIFEDVKKLPILTKEIIRREKENMFPDTEINDWHFDSISGGTTGEPLSFRHSGKCYETEQAGKILFDEWAERYIGDSQIRLWGSERDIISGKKDWMNKIYRFLRNEIFINTFRFDKETMDACIDEINSKQPVMILAYVQSVCELSKYIIENNVEVYSPKAIMTSAGTLTPEIIEVIKKAFKCKVLNRYGSREMGDMACSCGESDMLHINPFCCYLEVVDEEGEFVDKGVEGEILTTLLTDESMPIIRYAIGDKGILSDQVCSCGRGFPLLEKVTGRVIDFFINDKHEKVYGDYFTHLFYPCTNVKQFQVIQNDYNVMIVKLVFLDKKKGEEDTEFYDYYESNIKKVMGNSVKVKFEIVNDIPLSKSGKRIYTICNVNL